jgi:hypothetical protein
MKSVVLRLILTMVFGMAHKAQGSATPPQDTSTEQEPKNTNIWIHISRPDETEKKYYELLQKIDYEYQQTSQEIKELKYRLASINQESEKIKFETYRKLKNEEYELKKILDRPFDLQQKVKTLDLKKNFVAYLQGWSETCKKTIAHYQNQHDIYETASSMINIIMAIEKKIIHIPNLSPVQEESIL